MTTPDSSPVILVCDYSLAYLGGAQTAFLRQTEALLESGHTVIVVAPGSTTAFADREDERLRLIDPRARYTLPVLGLPVLDSVDDLSRMLEELIRSSGASGVILHSEFALAAAALRAARATGIPSLHVVHTFFWRAPRVLAPFAPLVRRIHEKATGGEHAAARYSGDTRINDALRTMTLRIALGADVVVSPSAHQAERLREAGVPDVRVVSNVAVPAKTTDVTRPLTLAWASRFAPEKRLPVALDAMRLVREKLGPGRVHLHVAGGDHGPHHDVTFHGRVPSTRIDELIELSDAVLLTSVGYDNQPMIVLESFAHGRAVIVSDPVLHQEFGDAVVLTPTPDAQGLADVICAAVADRGVLQRAGAHAAEYADTRSPRAHANALFGIITGATPTEPLSH